MNKHLAALAAMALIGVGGRQSILWAQDIANGTESGAETLGRQDAKDKIELIEKWSRQDKSLQPKFLKEMRVSNAISDLQKNPSVGVPLLTEAFVDKTKDRNFRIHCAQILRDAGRPIPSDGLAKMEVTVRDASEDLVVRVDAAHFLIRDRKPLAPAVKRSVIALARDALRKDTQNPHVRLMIIRPLVGDSDAEELMLDELRRKADLDPTVLLLGKMKSGRAIDPIVRLLRSGDKGFHKTRGYLALGEIGGPQAFDALKTFLQQNPGEMDRRMILIGLGLTKDSRARSILLDHFHSAGVEYFGASLQGLRYLGDKSVIPILEKELEKPLTPGQSQIIRRTIFSINAGGESPDW